MAVNGAIAGGPFPDLGEREVYRRLGLRMAGLAGNTFGEFWEDFDKQDSAVEHPAGWDPSGTAASTRSRLSGNASTLRMSTSAVAGTDSTLRSRAFLFNSHVNKRWYYATRARFTAIDAQAKLLIGIEGSNSGNGVQIGAWGPGSTANFGVLYDGSASAGSFLSLGTALDTSMHVFECWGGQGDNKFYARMDSGTIVSVAMSVTAADDYYMFLTARNGTTAADRQMAADWLLCVFQRA